MTDNTLLNDSLCDEAPEASLDDGGYSSQTVTYFIVGAGFLVGILFGVVLLMGRFAGGDEPVDPVAEARALLAEKALPSSVKASIAIDEKSSTNVGENVGNGDRLQTERARLEQELETLKLQQQVADLKRQLAERETSTVSTEMLRKTIASTTSRSPEPVSGPTGEATLAYWNKINKVIDREAAMRAVPLGGVTSDNAGRFLDARVRAADYAAEAIRDLDVAHADPRAVEIAEVVAAWYDDAHDVAQTGLELLTSGSVQERKGSAGKQYQMSEHDHADAVNAVNAKGERVRRALAREYGIAFPPLK